MDLTHVSRGRLLFSSRLLGVTATMPGLRGVWTLVEAAVECGMSSFERIYTKFLMTPNILDINQWPALSRAERAFRGWSRDTRGEGRWFSGPAASPDCDRASPSSSHCPELGSLPGTHHCPQSGRKATYSGASDLLAVGSSQGPHGPEARLVCCFKETGRSCDGQARSPARGWHVRAIKYLSELPRGEAFCGRMWL